MDNKFQPIDQDIVKALFLAGVGSQGMEDEEDCLAAISRVWGHIGHMRLVAEAACLAVETTKKRVKFLEERRKLIHERAAQLLAERNSARMYADHLEKDRVFRDIERAQLWDECRAKDEEIKRVAVRNGELWDKIDALRGETQVLADELHKAQKRAETPQFNEDHATAIISGLRLLQARIENGERGRDSYFECPLSAGAIEELIEEINAG